MASVLIAVAWKGSGGARAAQLSGIAFCEIRGITDHADSDAAHDFHENLHVAMTHVGQLLVAWSALEKPVA